MDGSQLDLREKFGAGEQPYPYYDCTKVTNPKGCCSRCSKTVEQWFQIIYTSALSKPHGIMGIILIILLLIQPVAGVLNYLGIISLKSERHQSMAKRAQAALG